VDDIADVTDDVVDSADDIADVTDDIVTSLDTLRTVASSRVGDFSDIKGSTIQDVLQRIPDSATTRKLTPAPGKSQVGVEFKWVDSEGRTHRLRVHDIDPSAPVGSNSASGWTARHQVGQKYYDPVTKDFHPRNVHNPSSPNFNPEAANNTHIPIQIPTQAIIDLMKN
jgi:hypothetical protein